MNAKHTPGPWIFRTEIGTVNAIDPIHSQDGRARIEICDPSSGQTWNGGALPIDEREANAHLIAAAPDLLAALQESETFCAALLSTIPLEDTSTRNRLAAQRKVIRAAIAKATGGQS